MEAELEELLHVEVEGEHEVLVEINKVDEVEVVEVTVKILVEYEVEIVVEVEEVEVNMEEIGLDKLDDEDEAEDEVENGDGS